jgi:hypothetical protein
VFWHIGKLVLAIIPAGVVTALDNFVLKVIPVLLNS